MARAQGIGSGALSDQQRSPSNTSLTENPLDIALGVEHAMRSQVRAPMALSRATEPKQPERFLIDLFFS